MIHPIVASPLQSTVSAKITAANPALRFGRVIEDVPATDIRLLSDTFRKINQPFAYIGEQKAVATPVAVHNLAQELSNISRNLATIGRELGLGESEGSQFNVADSVKVPKWSVGLLKMLKFEPRTLYTLFTEKDAENGPAILERYQRIKPQQRVDIRQELPVNEDGQVVGHPLKLKDGDVFAFNQSSYRAAFSLNAPNNSVMANSVGNVQRNVGGEIDSLKQDDASHLQQVIRQNGLAANCSTDLSNNWVLRIGSSASSR
ncbi:MAG: hypothetical protein SFZ03_09525, partial [Candidatus Melainabacteria bacterium]|nr:hypothetical protein [Candidatus Melainabacteria bacterium]